MSILQTIKTRRGEKASDVHDLARRIANGETIDPDRVIEACEEAGMSDEDFMDLVDLIDRREKLKRTAAEYESAHRDVTDAENDIAEAQEAFDKLVEKHEAALVPIRQRLRLAEKKKAAAREAEEKLHRDDMVPRHLRDAREDARRKLVAASDACRDPENRLAEHESLVKAAKATVPQDGTATRRMDDFAMIRMDEFEIARILESEATTRAHIQRQLDAARAKKEEAQAAWDACNRQCRDF